MALPTPECFKWLDLRQQITAIYEAIYEAAGSDPSLTPPSCFLGEDQRDQLTDLFAAIQLINILPPVFGEFLQPDGVSRFLQPDGISTFLYEN